MSKRVRSGITVSNRVGKPGAGYAEEKGAAWSRAPVIRSRTLCSGAAKSALRTRTSWSKRSVRHEPGLCFSGIGNNTRGRLQWKWLRQIDLVAWALPVWSASIGQVAAKRNQQNRGYQESQVGWDRSGLAAQEPKCYGTSDQVGSLKGTAFRPSVNASISNSALAAEGLRRDLTIVALHDLRCQQIGHRLSHADQPRTLAIHQHLSRAWPGVVVRGQRHAVRARV